MGAFHQKFPKCLLFLYFFFPFSILLHSASSLSFNFSSFGTNAKEILYEGDAFPSGNAIQLTRDQQDSNNSMSVGRAVYKYPIYLWNHATGKLADFSTRFSFAINSRNNSCYGDGMAFFLAPKGSHLPNNSAGGYLGLVNSTTQANARNSPFVAVEFDSFQNSWDVSGDHVGINVDSVASLQFVNLSSSIKDGRKANAWVSYDSHKKNLSVLLVYSNDSLVTEETYRASLKINLRDYLPQWITIGFTGASGDCIELHTIYSWDFNSSSLQISGASQIMEVILSIFGAFILVGIVGFLFYVLKNKKGMKQRVTVRLGSEKFWGPNVSYKKVWEATDGFSEKKVLGKGGCGLVYRGILKDQNGDSVDVAVKKFTRNTKAALKDYESEVRILSKLSHRNIVLLLWWCQKHWKFLLVYEYRPQELLLVYKYMHKGSLYSHLFEKEETLNWAQRYNIAKGLAEALYYLHERCDPCVLHRNIKSSNVFLDEKFNAKLGDFGLSRLVDHGERLQNKGGYLAPECGRTYKASKKSDVYGFGIVVLEIACGKKALEVDLKGNVMALVEWVWEHYWRHMQLFILVPLPIEYLLFVSC
ncbi:Legume lectin domain [Dillenia turbinata]|uniref:non-specific serine/threonine protein kinase n=1 Tax=Dillenia turbinata TaxID=194707 RepID=A0AAN8UIJ7_9MAGN